MSRLLSRLWTFRLGTGGATRTFWPAWHALAALLVLLGPAQVRGGPPVWHTGLDGVGQALLLTAAFLIYCLFLFASAELAGGLRILSAIGWASVAYGVASALYFARADIEASRIIWVIGVGFAAVLGLLPYLTTRMGRLTSATAALLAAVVAAGLLHRDVPARKTTRIERTSLAMVEVTQFRDLVETPTMAGGGLERLDRSFLLVTGDAAFYRLTWNGSNDALLAARLAMTAPTNREVLQRDLPQLMADPPRRSGGPLVRVTDLLVDASASPAQVFVAHQYWHSDRSCFTMRVSVASLDDAPFQPSGPPTTWRTLFESQPCLPFAPDFDDLETGGRLARLDGKILFTIGDHGYDGLDHPDLPQLRDNDYGKVVLIDPSGRHEIFSLGHRNPQGLAIDAGGRIWSTEHGPQGGDEVNLLARGHNYGWPLATYGTDYGRQVWPPAQGARDHGAFTEPAYTFVPSVGVSNLIALQGTSFPAWKGDLLVASLRGESLFRLRTRADRVMYAEPIEIGARVRDIVEGARGRILLWTDDGQIIVLAPGPKIANGAAVFEQCRACHESVGGAPAEGPSLRGLLGRSVGREPGFTYSAALQQWGGTWTEDRLNTFLEDPARTAPGSRMTEGRVPDPDERHALIEWLKTYR